MSRTSNVTAAFIDLATFELLESSLYGGSDAITYFVREVQKCTWFSQIPVKLTSNGTPAFGGECTWTVSRAADYLLGTWLRVELPAYTASSGKTIAYGANPGHNLIQKAELLFNDLEVQSFNSYDLDWYAALMVPGGKQAGYYNMIGERSTLTDLTSIGGKIAAQTINVPLPFFYTRDSGVALPTAALPYNDIKLKFELRELKDILVGWSATGLSGTGSTNEVTNQLTGVSATGQIGGVNVSTDGSIAPTGVTATGQPGTVTIRIDETVTLTSSLVGTATVGSVTTFTGLSVNNDGNITTFKRQAYKKARATTGG